MTQPKASLTFLGTNNPPQDTSVSWETGQGVLSIKTCDGIGALYTFDVRALIKSAYLIGDSTIAITFRSAGALPSAMLALNFAEAGCAKDLLDWLRDTGALSVTTPPHRGFGTVVTDAAKSMKIFKKLLGSLFVLGIAVVFGNLFAMCSNGSVGSGQASGGRSTDNSSYIPTVGDVYLLKAKRPLCLDDFKAFDELDNAEVKHDNEGASQILVEHEVNIPSGTRVRILNVDIFRSDVDVRVVSAGSDHFGDEIYCFIPPNSGGQPMFHRALQRV